ncbi:endonuclease domain-containing protein [Microbacterium aurugineum]|uniref:DUF559 domain-containing protein n=1 Tax=Microbacterium aurugineum TaxID=2851642 RepID=A0ABY4IWJ7_9MICO|nr:hypothetical protein [Microbacterium aurugineum]UPL16660.1 hypothetical protein KV397_02240 [Microbacterium aurugineum]
MRHRIPLPAELGAHFSVRDAEASGVGRKRHSARDLIRPYAGVRAAEAPASFVEHVECYVPRLRPGQRFAGRTALRLWGIPFPVHWTTAEPLDVAVDTGHSPPRTVGIRGRRIASGRAHSWEIGRVPVVDPVAAFFLCAAELTRVPMNVALEALITAADNYPGLHEGRPSVDVERIEQRLLEWGRFPGCGRIRRALPRVREGVESPKETETRMLLVDAGLPEPEIQHVVRAAGRAIARVDLAYPQWRIAIEYEGDGHRTSREQWRTDIRRQRDLEAAGWIVIRVTELDLRDGGAALVSLIRRAISSR